MIKEIYLRIKKRIVSESPLLFKRLRKISIRLVIASISIISANTSLSLALPSSLITALSYVIAIGVAVYGTAILTTKEEELK